MSGNHNAYQKMKKHLVAKGFMAGAKLFDQTEEVKNLQGECLMLADVLRDAFEVIKTVEGEDSDECEKLQDLRISIEYALGAYDDRRVSPNAKLTGDTHEPQNKGRRWPARLDGEFLGNRPSSKTSDKRGRLQAGC